MHHDEHFRTFVRRPGDTAHGIAEVDLIARMQTWLARSMEIAVEAGVAREQIVLDPGIGFFKTQEQNLEIMGRLSGLRALGCPLLLGASRKSVIGHVLGGQAVEDRLEGTLATTTLAVWQGVEIVRVHDVAANVRAARMAQAIRERDKLIDANDFVAGVAWEAFAMTDVDQAADFLDLDRLVRQAKSDPDPRRRASAKRTLAYIGGQAGSYRVVEPIRNRDWKRVLFLYSVGIRARPDDAWRYVARAQIEMKTGNRRRALASR
jgi:hypothetical protein